MFNNNPTLLNDQQQFNQFKQWQLNQINGTTNSLPTNQNNLI